MQEIELDEWRHSEKMDAMTTTYLRHPEKANEIGTCAQSLLNPTPISRTSHLQEQELKIQKQREQLNSFMMDLGYADCTIKHNNCQGVIHHNLNSGSWLLQRDEFREWSSAGNGVSSGLLWVGGKRESLRISIFSLRKRLNNCPS